MSKIYETERKRKMANLADKEKNWIVVKNDISDYSELQVAVLKATREILHKDRKRIEKVYEDWDERKSKGFAIKHQTMVNFHIAEIADIVFGKKGERTAEQLRAIFDTMMGFEYARKGVSYESDIFPNCIRDPHSLFMEFSLPLKNEADPAADLNDLECLKGLVISVNLKGWIFL